MAGLSDTAKLIASLELQDKFSKPLGAAGSSLGKFERSTATLGKGVGQVGAGIGKIATNLLKFGVVGAAALAGFVGANLKAGTEQVRLLELATAQTNAVLASTKGVAGQTGASVRALAERYESLNATMDDKVIQSAENVLLTFTSIGKEAFPLALDAALNLNQALGGGEEGLQGTIIQVGKALQDPIRGITALRRVGVNFSKEQVKQIKLLVEQNDLFGAQQLILKELGTEFGGSFAAAGDTAAGRTAKVKDNVEDLQRVFAGPFASALDKATGKFGDFLGETATIQRVEGLGEAIAGLFTDEAIDRGIGVLRGGLDLLSPTNLSKVGTAVSKAFDAIKGIDFSTIGKGLEITARVAKTAIDAFLALPKEVQGIAIAGLAANKLSGGLVGSGLGNIAKGLGGLLTGGGLLGRGSSPANPLWVQSATGGVGGAPGPGGAGGGFLTGLLGSVGIGAAIAGGFQNVQAAQSTRSTQDAVNVLTSMGIGGLIAKAVSGPIQGLIETLFPEARTVPKPPGPGARHPKGWQAPQLVDPLTNRLLSQIANRPLKQTPVQINLTVSNIVNASLLAARQYQIKTSAKIREG